MAGVAVSPHKLVLAAGERREVLVLRKPLLPKDDAAARRRPKPARAPQPVAVARRNARERNRVKQVNNGFANLRQHIPAFIAAAFESGRGGGKKLSKVETLRMAVEYIRSLEDALADDGAAPGSSASSLSSLSSPSPAFDGGSPPQYAFQVIPGHLYDEPLDVDEHILGDPSLLEFKGVQDLSLLNSDSLSPGMYSEQSLSPGGGEPRGYEVFGGGDVKSEDVPVISLKTENELPQDQKGSVMDVMQWWEQQQSPHTTIS